MKRKLFTAICSLALFTFLFTLQAKAETVTIYGSSSFTSITFVPTNGIDPAITVSPSGGTFNIPDGLYSVIFQIATWDSNLSAIHVQHNWDSWFWDPYTSTSYQQSVSQTGYADTDPYSPTYGQINMYCQVGENNNNVFYFYAY